MECLNSSFDTGKKSRTNLAESNQGIDGQGYAAGWLFFFLICGPIALSFLGLPNYAWGFLGMVHEMGHFIAMLSDIVLPGNNWFLVVLAGSLFEWFVPFASFLLFYADERFFIVGCVFLAFTGSALIDSGGYMASAQHPTGYGFINNKPVTTGNHDWFLIFSMLGVLEYSNDFSSGFFAMGHAVEYLGFYAALLGLFGLRQKHPNSTVFIYASVVSLVHASAVSQYGVAMILLFFSVLAFLFKEIVERL